MKLITEEQVDKRISEIDELKESEIQEIMNVISQDQPDLFSYLMSITELYNEEIREDFFFIGFTIMDIMLQNNAEIDHIGIDEIESHINKNLILFEELDGDSIDGLEDLIEDILVDYNQKFLLDFIIDELLVDAEGGGLYFEEDEIAIMAAYLKTLIDCLDK